jgi:hypothetical protein
MPITGDPLRPFVFAILSAGSGAIFTRPGAFRSGT